MSNIKMPSELAARGGGGQVEFEDQFIYLATAENLGAGQLITVNIQVEADAYFIIEKMSYMASIGGGEQVESDRVIPLVKTLITDTGSGRALMSGPVDISSMAGHEGLPFVTPVERWVAPNSSINVQFQNYSQNTVYGEVSLYLHGRKVWIK